MPHTSAVRSLEIKQHQARLVLASDRLNVTSPLYSEIGLFGIQR